MVANGLADRIKVSYAGSLATSTYTSSIADSSGNFKMAVPLFSGGRLERMEFATLQSLVKAGADCKFGMALANGDAMADIAGIGSDPETGAWVMFHSGSDSLVKDNPDWDGFEMKRIELNSDGEIADELINYLICLEVLPLTERATDAAPPLDGSYSLEGIPLRVTTTEDPAGHACCVFSPPGTVNLEIANSRMIISQGSGPGGSVPWLPFNVGLSSAGAANGSNMATVAGNANVTNTFDPNFLLDRLTGEISLGTQGRLPQGLPIRFGIEIEPTTEWPWLTRAVPRPRDPRIAVNGFRNRIQVNQGDPVSLSVSMLPGPDPVSGDWWLVAQAGESLFSFDLNARTWSSGLTPSATGPATEKPNEVVFTTVDGLPAGDYVFYFGIDDTVNGLVDGASLDFDSVTLSVTLP